MAEIDSRDGTATSSDRISAQVYRFNNTELRKASVAFWLLTAFLILVFLTGGSSRGDVSSLAILRPVSVIVCGIAFWTLKLENVRHNKWPIIFALVATLFVSIQLTPLPPSVWSGLAGRESISEIDALTGVGAVFRPISVVPNLTANSIGALVVPLAVFVLVIQLNKNEKFMILPVILALGSMSVGLGLLQASGNSESPLYLYNITNNGSAVGLFANRNHQAVFLACLIPMLAVFASSSTRTSAPNRLRTIMAVAMGTLLIPLVLVTGSRAGLLIAIIGLLSLFLFYRKGQSADMSIILPRSINLYYAFGIAAILALAALTVAFSRGEAIERLSFEAGAEDLRWKMWVPIAQMGGQYFPWGSGSGSFPNVYQLLDSGVLLNSTYVNQAHSDLLDIYLTAGLVGMALLLFTTLGYVGALKNGFEEHRFGVRRTRFLRLGAVILAMLALASFSDYPLRTPIMASLFVLASGWLMITSENAEKAGTI